MGRTGELYTKLLSRGALTPRRAAVVIAFATTAMTILCGVAMRLVDHQDFDNVWLALWWAVQTVTTVGYGDIVPKPAGARLIASILMLGGIAFITVVTAVVTAAFLQSIREHVSDPTERHLMARLDELDAKLDAIESALRR
jgi:voltage-gated potassium channel